MRYALATLLVIGSLLWAAIEFAASAIVGSLWNLVPLAGLLILLYSSTSLLRFLFHHHHQVGAIANIWLNLLAMAEDAERRGYGDDFWERLTLPPAEFRRRLRENNP